MTTSPTTVLDKYAADPASTVTSPSVTAALTPTGAHLSSGPFEWDSDLPPPLGGTGGSPSPTAYLLGALAGCAVAFVADTLAPEFGIEIGKLSAMASCRADIAGLVGAPGAVPDLTDVALTIDLDTPSDPEAVTRLQEAWLARCPVLLALTRPVGVTVDFGVI
ncbi:OsmC family protein [Nocardioides speluncae]|uniref:OsmC family protein n=1 Tax=Nocardioides speluncae TaxID=2670337 RepID=UPI0019811FB6|nr:OsmC family protein [Nocardioides speluncae]